MTMMDPRSLYFVRCDGEGCEAVASAEPLPYEYALRVAGDQGWNLTQVHGGDDLCPACQKGRDEQYEQNERDRKKSMEWKVGDLVWARRGRGWAAGLIQRVSERGTDIQFDMGGVVFRAFREIRTRDLGLNGTDKPKLPGYEAMD
jgi:hypothetical protein